MQRLTSLIVATALIAGLSGCGGESQPNAPIEGAPTVDAAAAAREQMKAANTGMNKKGATAPGTR